MSARLFAYAVIATRVFLGLTFLTSGMGKLTHGDFPGFIGPVWLEERLAQYGLGLWAQFVAWSQLAVGLLLLSQRFALLGAIMLVPMLANIFVVTVSLQWRGTPYVNAMLLAMNVLLLFAERHKLKLLLIDDDARVRTIEVRRRSPILDLFCLAGIVLCVLAPVAYRVSRGLMFALVAAGLLLFIGAAIRAGRATPRPPFPRAESADRSTPA